MPSQKVKAVDAQYPYGEPRISLDTYAGAEEHLLQEYQKKRRADAQRPLREMLCWLRMLVAKNTEGAGTEGGGY